MKKIRNIIRTVCLLLALMVLGACRHTENYSGPKQHILVLLGFPLTNQSATVIQKAFREEFRDTARYQFEFRPGVSAPYERVLVNQYFDDQSGWVYTGLERMGRKPDLILLQSDLVAQAAALSGHPWLQDVPVICFDVQYPEWKGQLARHKNFVVMESKPEPKKNIDFIRRLGRPSWILTGLDSTFLDDKLRRSIMEEMGQDTTHYITNLQYETYRQLLGLSERDLKRSTLIPLNFEHTTGTPDDTLYIAGFRLHGILKVRNNHATFLRLKDDVYIDKSLGYNLGVTFSNSPRYFNLPLQSALNVCAGGYLTTWEDMAKSLHPIVDDLLKGKDPSSIPPQVLEKKYWLDWRAAKCLQPYAEDFPKDVHFVNLPWKDESRFNHYVYDHWKSTLLVVIVLISLLVPYFLIRRSRRVYRQLQALGAKAEHDIKQMENLLAATRSFSWELLPGDRVRFSEEFAKVWGFEEREIPLSRVLGTLSEGGEELEKALRDTSRKCIIVETVATHSSSGKTHAFICYVNHVSNEQGERHCLGFTIANDEAHEARRIRREAYRMAEETSVKESFLAAMSHEIRSPLNAIVGFADVLVKQYSELSDEERTAFSHYINESKEQLLKLLDDVMNYSERKGEKFALELSRKSVRELMDEVYYMHTVIVPEPLKLQYHCGEDAVVMTNRSAVLQIMSNLMNNAIKFTRRGSITLGWETEVAEDGTWMCLYVEDTGIGISKEYQHRLFEKFYKMDTHSAGAGLGLTLCLQLADSMQGSIRLESTEGKGSMFSLRLKKAADLPASLGGGKVAIRPLRKGEKPESK